MKLRNYRNSDREYSIGIDAGTASVGWAVVDDESGDLCYFKNQPTWGSRLFDGADFASTARTFRGQRRRYDRRRQRITLLQDFFKEEVEKIDPEFFVRLNNSFRVQSERNFDSPLFNGTDFTEKAYYDQFPTIYHLRDYLTKSDDKSDIRLIYLALHNIVKARGNFLYQDNPKLSAKNANMREAVENLKNCLTDYMDYLFGEGMYPEPNFDIDEVIRIFEDRKLRGREREEKLIEAFGFNSKPYKDLEKDTGIVGVKDWGKVIADAGIDYVADFKKIFNVDAESAKFNISNDEKTEEFKGLLDEGLALFEALQKLYSSYKLMDILGESKGEMLSACKIKEYNDYHNDLVNLKYIFKLYFKDEFEEYFRGELYADGSGYNKQKSKGYTRYNLCRGAKDREDFLKDIKKRLGDLSSSNRVSESDLELVKIMLGRAEEGTFLKRLKTGESGVIPYQLHLEEMDAIIDHQSKFYPFLLDNKDKIESLVTFRIPYYVGPLTQNNAAKDKHGNNRFAWSERLDGKENEKIYPWNWDDIIDKYKSATNFMNRMIGECTYLYGKQVLPKCSLLYEEFCVLNEMNVAKMSQGDGEPHRFDSSTRELLITELFERKKTVSHAAIRDLLRQNGHITGDIRIFGTQDESKFVSKLSTYRDFCNILGCEKLDRADYPMIEEIVLWCSLFEDKDIVKKKISVKYSDRFDASQIKQIIKKPYTGWGRLSGEFLKDLKVEVNDQNMSIIDILRYGNPIDSGRTGRMQERYPMNLMEILSNKDLGFKDKIDELNKDYISVNKLTIDDMQGSPALKRTVNQAQKIVKEIVAIAGKPPKNIFIEYTRDIDPKDKNKRTKTRKKSIENALNALKKEFKDTEFSDKVYSEFKGKEQNDLNDERLVLYFMQNGKSMYSGRPLDINNLSQYQVDHIIPQCYTKDDSFDNKVLVYQDENQRKLDNLLLDSSIQNKNRTWWKALYDSKLISEKKYINLMRTSITNTQMESFAARQLVETNQIVKFMKEMFEDNYPGTFVNYVKASVSSSLRSEDALDLPKCRDINDFHHAHDAYLACRVGMFVRGLYPSFYDNPIGMAHIIKSYVKDCKNEWEIKHKTPGTGGFITSRFMRSIVDTDTGEILWDIEREAARIRRVFDYKQVFISRMPEEITSNGGAFWDSLPLTPKNQNHHKLIEKGVMPIKKGRNPIFYGYYNNSNSWVSVLYSCTNKRGKTLFRLLDLKLVDKRTLSGNARLKEYCESDASLHGYIFKEVLKFPIFKNQILELNGCRYRYVSSGEIKSVEQIAFSLNQTKVINRIIDISDNDLTGRDVTYTDQEFLSIYRYICEKLPSVSFELFRKLKLVDLENGVLHPDINKLKDYSKLSDAEKLDMQNNTRSLLLTRILNCIRDSKRFDFTLAGGGSDCGRTTISLNKYIEDITFIDQSVTGMFEHKYKVCD